MFTNLIYLYILLIGFSVGSFLNCLIYRLEIGKKPVGRSFCPNCKHILFFLDLIPLFSFLFLKGKCRYCKKKISWQYPLLELLTAIIFVAIFSFISPSFFLEFILLINLFFCFSLLLVIFIYDLKHYIIPNKIIYSAIVSAFFHIVIKFFIENNSQIFINHIITAFLVFLFFFSIYFLTKEKGIGFGDVKYAFFLGLFLGFPNSLVALFFSFTAGAILGVILIGLKIKKRKDMIPFGPFLVLGTFIGFFLSEIIISWYFNLLIL